jgi:hypothetical protein
MPVERSNQNSGYVGAALRKHGARSMCYLMSNSSELDRRTMTLVDALRLVVDADTYFATFISCLPGRLAYFHDEEPTNRFILFRTDE